MDKPTNLPEINGIIIDQVRLLVFRFDGKVLFVKCSTISVVEFCDGCQALLWPQWNDNRQLGGTSFSMRG